MEIDGIPLTGNISASNLKASLDNNFINLKWVVQNKEGNAKIWLATTNNFKSGGKDDYQLLKEVPVVNGKAKVNIKKYPSEFYKIVLEMPFNFLNRWILVK
jgi:hypothetical protein